jgi:hypothetical protein
MFGCPCRRKRDPFCNAARGSFDSRNRIEFQELTAASYCGVWNKNIGSGCAVLPYRHDLTGARLGASGSIRSVSDEGCHSPRNLGGERCSCSMPATGPFGRSRRNQARRTTCTGISMRPAPRPTPSPPSAISTNDFYASRIGGDTFVIDMSPPFIVIFQRAVRPRQVTNNSDRPCQLAMISTPRVTQLSLRRCKHRRRACEPALLAEPQGNP